jgi:hypothetical protein
MNADLIFALVFVLAFAAFIVVSIVMRVKANSEAESLERQYTGIQLR